MSESCNHDCGNCSQSCGSGDPKSFIEQPHEKSHIKKVVGVVSGKGGVGKSLVTALLASAAKKQGKNLQCLTLILRDLRFRKCLAFIKERKAVMKVFIP